MGGAAPPGARLVPPAIQHVAGARAGPRRLCRAGGLGCGCRVLRSQVAAEGRSRGSGGERIAHPIKLYPILSNIITIFIINITSPSDRALRHPDGAGRADLAVRDARDGQGRAVQGVILI